MKKIKEARQLKKISQSKMAKDLGIGCSTLSQYENGKREPDQVMMLKIAEYLMVSIDYLYERDNIQVISIEGIEPIPKWKKVPLIGTIACGTPTLAEENIEDYVKMADTIHADFCLRCKGDSMINARIFDGDYVFIRQQDEVENGEIGAILIGNEATLKRVYIYPNRVELRAENPTFAPINIEGSDLENLRILGKAVAFISTVR